MMCRRLFRRLRADRPASGVRSSGGKARGIFFAGMVFRQREVESDFQKELL
ncbi:hypothetical protein HMPREF1986_02155 [Oribacterium sp. oral taxon 078 str. F0263]|nr:hypothetical protein HMPREF1986_02155 [Oribacterium sp. oral taxon 078 str. F0263]